MIRKVLFVALAMIAFVACNNTQQKAGTDNNQQTEEVEMLVLAPEVFQDKAGEIIGQQVKMEGTVVHVCKHGGKKMFIMGSDPDKGIKINAPDDMAAFQPELEGSYVVVTGIVEEIEIEEPEAEEQDADADHENYYHKPQYSLLCVDYIVKEAAPEEESEEAIEE